MSTPFIRIVLQRCKLDCGVACLAMLLGTEYEETLVAFRTLTPLVAGVSMRQVQMAAKRLGRPLEYTRKISLDNDTGLLAVGSTRWAMDHLVVLKEGMIIDTDATIWEADVFMSAYEARPLSLLREKREIDHGEV